MVSFPIDFILIASLLFFLILLQFLSVVPKLSVEIDKFFFIESTTSKIKRFAESLDKFWSLLFATPDNRIFTAASVRRILILSTMWCSLFYIYPLDNLQNALQWGFFSFCAFLISLIGGYKLSKSSYIKDWEQFTNQKKTIVTIIFIVLIVLTYLAIYLTTIHYTFDPENNTSSKQITEYSAGILALEASILGIIGAGISRKFIRFAPFVAILFASLVSFIVFLISPHPALLAGPIGIPASSIIAPILIFIEFSSISEKIKSSINWILWLVLFLSIITVQGSDFISGVSVIGADVLTDIGSIFITRKLIKLLIDSPKISRLFINSVVDIIGVIVFISIPFIIFYFTIPFAQHSMEALTKLGFNPNQLSLFDSLNLLYQTYLSYFSALADTTISPSMIIISFALFSNAFLTLINIIISSLFLVGIFISKFSTKLFGFIPQKRPKAFSVFAVAYMLFTAFFLIRFFILWGLQKVFLDFQIPAIIMNVDFLKVFGLTTTEYIPLAIWLAMLGLYFLAINWYDSHQKERS